MTRLGLRTIKKPNLVGSFGNSEKSPAIDVSLEKTNLESKLSQSEAKVEPQPEPIHRPELSQSAVKVEPTDSLLALVGLQRSLLIFLFENCQQQGTRLTNPISISNTAIAANTTPAAARKALQRLEQKKFIRRHSYKDGRGGHTTFELPSTTYTQLFQMESRAKLRPNLSPSAANVRPQPEPQPEPTALSSVIKSLDKQNTKTEEFLIPENLRTLGVGQRNLQSILSDGALSFEEIQTSLEHFSHDFETGVIKKNGLNLLMGVLRRKNCYISSSFTHETERDLAEHLKRIAAHEENKNKLAQAKRAEEFKKYLETNPEFLEEVRQTTGGGKFNLSDEMLNKMAFARWSDESQAEQI